MTSAWLRCIGSIGEYRRCQLCSRHLGEGMKKNCRLHQRTAKIRVPAREHHVSAVYQKEWRRALLKRPGVKRILEDATPTAATQTLIREAIERECLAPDVADSVASLGALLHTFLPLLRPALQTAIKQQFDSTIRAVRTQQDDGFRLGLGGARLDVFPRRAVRGLEWERFFGAFFVSNATTEIATTFARGKPIDLDHPLTSELESISLEKLALDLVHLNAWISVDTTFDAYGFLDPQALSNEISATLDPPARRLTYKELAQRHHTSPQAVHQAVGREATSSKRRRVLGQGVRALQVRFDGCADE